MELFDTLMMTFIYFLINNEYGNDIHNIISLSLRSLNQEINFLIQLV